MIKLFRWNSQALLATTVFLGIVGFYSLAAVRYPVVYIQATYEDLYGEWIQFWAMIVAMVLSITLVTTKWRFRWFFLLLAISCFYVAMEEISWGQRVLGFSSPAYFRANNLQGETNLHNFLAGPYGTSLKATLAYGLAAALAMYGLIYPAMLTLRWRFALWLDAHGVASPPFYLWPYFVAAAYLECTPFRFNEAEIAEVLVGLGLALTAMHYRTVRGRQMDGAGGGLPESGDEPPPIMMHGRCAGLTLRIAMATAVVLILGVATTTAVYASPAKRSRIDRRLVNGLEKFAGRYARYEQWVTAIDLYERVHEKKPKRVSILRRLATCAERMGSTDRFEGYLQEALEYDLRRHGLNPKRASVHRSLVRTYRLLGEEEKARDHLQQALKIAQGRVEKHPRSAASAYSLGKAYLLMGRTAQAVTHLSRAAQLEPTSKKYRRAYFSANKAMP